MFVAVYASDVDHIQRFGIKAIDDATYVSASESAEKAVKEFLSWQPTITPADVAVFQVTKLLYRCKTLAHGGFHIYTTLLPPDTVQLVSGDDGRPKSQEHAESRIRSRSPQRFASVTRRSAPSIAFARAAPASEAPRPPAARNETALEQELSANMREAALREEIYGKVQPRLDIVAWFLRSRCTKYCQNVQNICRAYKCM